MTESLSEQGQFQDQLHLLYKNVLESDRLQPVRAKAWDHFLELGLPSRKTEAYRYLRMRQFFSHQYTASRPTPLELDQIAPYILPECKQSVLVFVNGHFDSTLSNIEALPKKIVLSPLKEAMKTYGSFLNNQWAKSIKEETDPFAALNTALHPEGAFLYLPPKTIVETPVQILHLLHTEGEPMAAMPRTHLFVGAQSQIDLYSTQATISGNTWFVNGTFECTIEEEAHVKYTQAYFDEPLEAWHFESFRASLKRNSTLNTISATDGGAGLRLDYRVGLGGENAEALLNGAWFLNGKKEAHTHVVMDHQAPYCRSMQLYKGVVNDFSRSSFEGKILVRQPAQKTEAFQLNNNLLLSDRASADSKPNLEIFADDVKASHGATVGQLDKEQLFYMKTRGFSLIDAQKILVTGFCKEVFEKISLPSLCSAISERMESYLTPKGKNDQGA